MTSPVNSAYFTALTAQVNAAGSCAELQAIVSAAFESILAQQTAATAQLATIEPMLGLLTAPATNPTAIVSYLNTLITYFLTPQLKPAVTLAAQLTALIAAISALTAAITTKSGSFHNCSITIPT